MEELAQELEQENLHMKSSPNRPQGIVPAGAVPVQQNGTLSAHAAEFWFPECRECKCCLGFKYGCPCRKRDGFIACQDETCKVEVTEKGIKAPIVDTTSSNSSSPKKYNQTSGNNNFNRNLARSGSNNSNPTTPSAQCKYELSATGCMYGANCRFKHTQQQQAFYPPAPYPMGGNSGTYYPPLPANNMTRSISAPATSTPNYYPNGGNRSYPSPTSYQQRAVSQSYPFNVNPSGGSGVPPNDYPPSATVAGGGGASAGAGVTPAGVCPYFQIGQCMFGDNCRNRHLKPNEL
jgi:hypothetical protein